MNKVGLRRARSDDAASPNAVQEKQLRTNPRFLKSQSAMEYLMTYGWAILIIAIVIIALFQLGLLNGTNFTPHATAGACQVKYHNDVGQCNNLEPQFVANLNQNYIVTSSKEPQLTNATISFWIYVSSIQSSGSGMGPLECQIYMTQSSNNWSPRWDPCSCGNYAVCSSYGQLTIPISEWEMVAFTLSNGNVINSYAYVSPSATPSVSTGTFPASNVYIPTDIFYINSYAGNPIYKGLIGSVANVQLYNSSLSSTEIQTLYQEGIGGAPVDPTHILGWWPLNGNAQDYSGNNNGGTGANVVYSGQWTSGYTQP